jgi:hypothetical protein
MIEGAVNFATKILDQLPATDGVLSTHSPRTTVTGSPPLDYRHFALEFGEHETVFEEKQEQTGTNTAAARAVDTIALYHTGNV